MFQRLHAFLFGYKLWHPNRSTILTRDIGRGTVIHSHVWIGHGVKIGKNCRIQAFSFIPEGVTIEDNVFIGPRVTFTNDKYPPSKKENWRQTLVKSNAKIGAGVTILPGVTIGEGARIGAGSLVTKNIPDKALAFGVPAVIKS